MHRRMLLKSVAATLLAAPGSGISSLAAPAIAQPANTATLRFVPQANLTLLDPVFTTATVTSNHGYYVFDTLYSVGPDGVSHVGLYVGVRNGKAMMVDAPHSGANVRVEAFPPTLGAPWGSDLVVGFTRPG